MTSYTTLLLSQSVDTALKSLFYTRESVASSRRAFFNQYLSISLNNLTPEVLFNHLLSHLCLDTIAEHKLFVNTNFTHFSITL